MKRFSILVIYLLAFSVFADDNFKFITYEKSEFSPAQGGVFSIPFELESTANVSIDILSPDGDLVRELKSNGAMKKGVNKLIWDGKDSKGNVVADEAYLPILHATDIMSGETSHLDMRTTGGEVVENLSVTITPNENISFKLPYPSRVLSRVGIKGGPMLRTLTNWEPKSRGRIIIRWDGFDQDKLRNIYKDKKLSVLVRAYRLSEYSIITSGNKNTDYRQYRKTIQKPNWQPINKNDYILERNGKQIERHYYVPKSFNLSPAVLVKFLDSYPKDDRGRVKIKCPCPVQVNLTGQEKIQLQGSLYEISFFIDNEFVSEQEQGYVPFTWRWNPSKLEAGEHMLTVNVSGLRGEVGVKSLLLFVEEP
jgi:hypothetical protein